MTQESDDAETIIRHACRSIAGLYDTAVLIADRLATPRHDRTPGGHTTGPDSPIRLGQLDTILQADEWLRTALAAIGMPYASACHAVETRAPMAAATIGDNADALAALPDGADWARDAARIAHRLEAICHEDTTDPDIWRGALVYWRPEEIADTLTDLTGHSVTGHRLRVAASRGKIHVTDGRIILGEAASAIGL